MGLIRVVVTVVSIVVAVLAFLQSPLRSHPLIQKFVDNHQTPTTSVSAPLKTTINMAQNVTRRPPTYFFSHGGPTVQYQTEHPAYAVLQAIGKEITEKVKPTAVVVFSAHWQAGRNDIEINSAESTDLIYDFYGFPDHFYQAQYPNKGSPALASQIGALLADAGIKSAGVTRGLDHGVWSGFSVAFDPETNPLDVPLVQVSIYDNEDPNAHYRLGQAVAALRDQGIVVIGAGMSVHNLRAMRSTWGDPVPQPWAVSFDEALKFAALAPPAERQDFMAQLVRRPDARKAHPSLDHLMPVYVAAGAAADEQGTQIWTMQEGSFAWAQYRFGDVPE